MKILWGKDKQIGLSPFKDKKKHELDKKINRLDYSSSQELHMRVIFDLFSKRAKSQDQKISTKSHHAETSLKSGI